MAEFIPFRGLRPNTEKLQLADVIAPPYDVIKGSLRDELLARSPFNIVAVELPAPYGQQATEAQYIQAGQTLRDWQAQGVLVRDDAAYYIYEQEFEVPGTAEVKKRRGVLGALRVEEFGETVKPHEHTLSGPKQDRLNLLRAARTNTSPIFGLFADDDGWVERVLETVCVTPPLASALDSEGITHRLWRLHDDESVNAIQAAFENEPIFIADGHHRYETALNYRNERQAQAEKEGRAWTGYEDENFVMMMCVSTSDDGLVVLPTHRLVKNVDAAKVNGLLDALAEYFDIEEVEYHSAPQQAAMLLDALSELPDERGRLGLNLPGRAYVLQLRAGDTHLASMEDSRSRAYNNLDVSLLHTLIMQNLLGVGPSELAAGQHVSYTINAAEAIQKVNEEEYALAFILRSTPVAQVQEVADAGDKMPQKSTYFYPKLVTGWCCDLSTNSNADERAAASSHCAGAHLARQSSTRAAPSGHRRASAKPVGVSRRQVRTRRSASTAALREAREELGVEIEVLGAYSSISHEYSTRVVTLHPFSLCFACGRTTVSGGYRAALACDPKSSMCESFQRLMRLYLSN
jgi:uncharacterized protein (DUF1015 family)